MAGRIDSWSIRWDYAHFKHDGIALYPVESRVYNIGLDGSGVHCRKSPYKQQELTASDGSKYRFPERVEIDPEITREIARLHRVGLLKQFAYLIKDRMEKR